MPKKKVILTRFEQLLAARINAKDSAASTIAAIYLFEHRANPDTTMFRDVVTEVFHTREVEARLRARGRTFSDVLINLEACIQTIEDDWEAGQQDIRARWTDILLRLKLEEFINGIISWFDDH